MSEGGPRRLEHGDAFDVKVKPVVEKREKVTNRRWKTSMKYTLSNAGSKPVTVILKQDGLWGDTKIEKESLKSTRPNADQAQWSVTVPANGSIDVTAVFDSSY